MSLMCYRVPLYAISSLIAIFSLEAAFFIDAIRDLYEVSPVHKWPWAMETHVDCSGKLTNRHS